MAVPASDLRRGQAINYNGDIGMVLDVQHHAATSARSVQATLRSIRASRGRSMCAVPRKRSRRCWQ
ncbi:MAG: hypothetical protein U1F83_19780 [Verrucomicrobiota bacterium]